MMVLNGYYEQNQLLYWLRKKEISLIDYFLHCREREEQFLDFCKTNELSQDEKAANLFKDWILTEEEKAHTDGLDEQMED